VSRTALALLLVAATAAAAPKIVLVDGTELDDALLVAVEKGRASVQEAGGGLRQLPVESLVLATAPDPQRTPAAGSPFNLYLRGGDRLRGAVTGDGDHVRLDSPVVVGLRVHLDDVAAVRFGRLLGALQASFGEAFDREMKRGRDVIVIQRDTRPFPVNGRVLGIGESALNVRVEGDLRDLDFARVYGFIRTPDRPPTTPPGVRARVHLAGGERVTLPLERVTAEAVEGGGVRVAREHVERIEFLGDHIAHLGEFDPIDVKHVALFGEPPPCRPDGMALGGPLRIANRTYERGLGTLSYSRIEYVLGGRWESFFVRCGIDDAAGPEGDAIFRILGDGKVLAEIRRRRGERPEAVRVDVAGVDRLVLENLPGESYVSDFCDWAEARVFNTRAGPPEGE